MLPNEIVSYLQSLNVRRPFCFLINEEYQLLQLWGKSNASAFEGLNVGDSMLENAPFLLGTLSDEIVVLPFVTNSDGDIFEVHTLPHEGKHYVILLNVAQKHSSLQSMQQKSNEVHLLHASQKKLIQRQRELIGELVEAKAELDHRRREAERNNARKNEFIAMMSHEFRTPLSSIINYAELAIDQMASPANIKNSVEAISRASTHLASLVETVLDDAELEAKRSQVSEVSFEVRSLVDDMAAIMAPLAAEKGLGFAAYLEDAVPEHLFADVVFLRQILINLLGNAVKYTDTGNVQLRIGWHEDNLTANVIDTGPGIDSEDKERMFQAFERGGDTHPSVSGAGLGLAISLDLARQMRGQLDISSEPGSGCSILLTLPAPIPAQSDASSAILPNPAVELNASRQASVLVCDDDEDMLALCEHYLHQAGYGLILANNGLEAISKALTCSPDIVLMDIHTPKMNGVDAAKQLRKSGFTDPILAVSAADINNFDNDCFSGSLRKPFQMAELLTEIKQHLG